MTLWLTLSTVFSNTGGHIGINVHAVTVYETDQLKMSIVTHTHRHIAVAKDKLAFALA